MRQKIWYILTMILITCTVIWQAMRTEIVINHGVRIWNTVRTNLGIASLIFAAISVWCLVQAFLKKRKQVRREQDVAKERLITEQQRKQPASLSMKGQLNTETIVGLLTDTINGENGDWSRLKLQLMECREQLYKMDRYQEKLHGLLMENDAQKLENTEEIVARVEQYMLQNTRKICNYVQIYDSSDMEGFGKTAAQAESCLQDNKKQLGHVQELLTAIADFLNSQGQDSSALDTMEIYKKMIIETIR